MNEQMILDRMAQIIRVGFVNARQPEKMRLKVTIPDTTGQELVTDWLPVLCPRACQDMQYDLPDIGDQVLCLFLPYGLEQGFVLGAMYGKQTPPVQSGDKWHRLFSDGTWLEYDRASHTLNGDVKGTVTLKADQSVTIETPIIYLRGTLVNTAMDGSPGKAVVSGGMEILNGGLNVDSDVVASGVSLVSHKTEGVQAGNDTSSHPAGGSAESPGTGAIAIPGYGTAAYATYIDNRLQELSNYEIVKNNPIFDLITCLPTITNAMAERDRNELDRQGWIYLHEFFEKWLAGPSNRDPFLPGIEPMRVKFEWLISFNRSAQCYIKLIDKNMLFSENARELLKERLKDDRKFIDTDAIVEFDYINIPWHEWKNKYYQSIGVPAQKYMPDIGMDFVIADGLQIAMASFMLYALASGTVQLIKDNKYEITIKNIAIVAFDTFNFDGVQEYRYWRCKPPDWAYFKNSSYTQLSNADFQEFQNKTARGCAFAVISGPKWLDYPRELSYEITL